MQLPKNFVLVSRTNVLHGSIKQGSVVLYRSGIKIMDKQYSSIQHRDLIISEISRILNKTRLRLVA
jgi:hypothetical protein